VVIMKQRMDCLQQTYYCVQSLQNEGVQREVSHSYIVEMSNKINIFTACTDSKLQSVIKLC